MSEATALRGSRYWVSGFPHLMGEWDRERNGVLTPETVSAGSARMIWWRCAKGPDHVWRAKPNNRTRGAGCPFCTNRRVSRTNNLGVCFPLIAAEWHPTKNGRTRPLELVAASSRVCWWRCRENPAHEWRASVRDRTRGQTECPFCSQRRASFERSLAECHPTIAAEWHPTRNHAGLGTPRLVAVQRQRQTLLAHQRIESSAPCVGLSALRAARPSRVRVAR
jgi:hypothetical protein